VVYVSAVVLPRLIGGSPWWLLLIPEVPSLQSFDFGVLVSLNFFAACPRGLEELLTQELLGLGIDSARVARAGVRFHGDMEDVYKALLWSRIASRITMELLAFEANDTDELYYALREFDFLEHMDIRNSFAFRVDLRKSGMTNSHFAAMRAKDALVDRFRDYTGDRPSVNSNDPDLKFHIFVDGRKGLMSIDLSGPSLYMRGYREAGGVAPIKESLAAALLYRCRWPEIAEKGGALIDPFCGSGTVLIEGLLMAMNAAPGLLRNRWGFDGWKQHQPELWDKLCVSAEEMERTGDPPTLMGFDMSPASIDLALTNLGRAGFPGMIKFEARPFEQFSLPPEVLEKGGLILTNPPYGERIGEKEELRPLYQSLGRVLSREAIGFDLGVFTGNPDLGKEMGLLAKRSHNFFNGPIECQLLRFELRGKAPVPRKKRGLLPDREPTIESEAFTNRLKKNLKRLKSWAKREEVSCYRIYDRDLAEYNVSIDQYADQLYISEYEADETVDQQLSRHRLDEIILRLFHDFDYHTDQIHLKHRRKQKGTQQYESFEDSHKFFEIDESGLRFNVDLDRYLDTGLFLDHRPTRQLIKKEAWGTRFLNLFCYTGSATIYAASGGAKTTTSVDLSSTYLDWTDKNLALNNYAGDDHQTVKANVIEWLKRERQEYDLIFCDPPTFSNSKGMDGFFEVQRDHVDLIRSCLDCLAKDGLLIFSNNYRTFKLDEPALSDLSIEDISFKSIPEDFSRNQKIHKTYLIRRA